MKMIILKIFFLVVPSLFSQTWITQNSGVTSSLNSLCFVDSLNGWIVGDNSTALKTIDGGNNWIKQPLSGSLSLVGIQNITNTIGYMLSSDGIFLSTKNGGSNWYTNNIMYDSVDYNYNNICFVDEKEGWITANKETMNYNAGLILHTIDSGKTWSKQFKINTGQIRFTALQFFDNKVGWALALNHYDSFASTYVYKTLDGGKNWDNISIIESMPETKLKIIGADTLWASGSILNTSFDGGESWINYWESNLSEAINTVPLTGFKGWTYSHDFNTSEYRILYTPDAGQTWEEELKWEDININDMIYNAGILWLVGAEGVIKKRVDVVNSINDEPIIPISCELYQNYPNPFNPTTTISFSIPQYSHVIIKVYDILGEEIRELTNNYFISGQHTIIFEASNIPSGIYFCSIFTNNFTKTIKMILQK